MMTIEAITQAVRDSLGAAGLDPDDPDVAGAVSNIVMVWSQEQEWDTRRDATLRGLATLIRAFDGLHFDPKDLPTTVFEQLARARGVVAEVDRLDRIDAETKR